MTNVRLITVFAAILGLFAAPAFAQFGWFPPIYGPEQPVTQPTHDEGRISLSTDLGQQFLLREIDYMIAPWPSARTPGSYRAIDAVRWEGGMATRHAAGVDLHTGVAYFQIEPPALPLGPGDVVRFMNTRPDQYVPVLLGGLAERDVVAADVAERVSREMITLIQRGARAPYGVFPPGDDNEQDLENRLRRLIYSLDPEQPGAKDSPDARARRAMEAVHTGAELKYIQAYIGIIAYPFMMTRRLVGGAEGTEGVAWVDPDPNDPEACDVYYVYLHSDSTHPMRLQGFEYVDEWLQAMTAVQNFNQGEYVRARLVRKPFQWSHAWFVESFDAPKPFTSAAPQALRDAVAGAHEKACDLGAFTPADVMLPGIELRCN